MGRASLGTWLLFILALAAAGARWATRTPVVYGWDSVHYILAQERYDILAHQPHPPGSWYYVSAARSLSFLTGDPHASLLLLSALSGAALVVTLYLLARELAGEAAGWMAAAIAASAPLFWFYGSVGLNYGPGGALCALTALGCVRLCRGVRPLASGLLAGAALGLLGGFRPTDVVFLAPAYLWALASSKAEGGRRKAEIQQTPAPLSNRRSPQVWSVALFGVLSAGWVVPNVLSAGGVGSYLQSIASQEHLLARTSALLAGWPALNEARITHLRCLESTLGVAWIFALVGLALLAGRALFEGWKVRRFKGSGPTPNTLTPNTLTPHTPALVVLGLLIVMPAFLFYLLGHFNSPGYALTYSGYLAAAGAALVAQLQRSNLPTFQPSNQPTHPLTHPPAPRVPAIHPYIALLVLLGNSALFLSGWPGTRNLAQRALSYVEIEDHARYYRELETFLLTRYRPGEVRILSSWNSTDGLRVVQALLPDYAADVAQAVGHIPELPPAVGSLPWLRLMTPAQIRAEGRPVFAVVRTFEDPPFHHDPAVFDDAWDTVPIGPGHVVYRLRGVEGNGSRSTKWTREPDGVIRRFAPGGRLAPGQGTLAF